MNLRIVGTCVVVLLLAVVIQADAATYYLSPTGSDSNNGTSANTPFLTLEKARQAVDAINDNMTADIYVYLRGGTYNLTNTLNLTEADSASNGYRIHYQAYGDEVPVVNGGTLVTGWTQHEDNIYRAPLNRSGKLRTLIVNGRRAYMANSGNIACTGSSGTYTITAGQADWAWISGSKADGATYSTDSIGELSNPGDVEITKNTTWNVNTVCVRDIVTEGSDRIFLLQQPSAAIAMNQRSGSGFSASGTHVIHNAYELLDSPGEFYFDDAANVLYYYRDREDMSTAEVYAPLLGTLIDIQGADISHRVENITFKGITFANTEALLPEVGGSSGKGTVQASTWCLAYADDDLHSDKYRAYDVMLGAIVVNNADSIRFEDNIIKHIGNEGICLINDVNNTSIIGNLITDVGGSAIQVGHPQHLYERDGGENEKYGVSVEGVCRDNLIENNLLIDMTVIYAGHAGITGYFVNGLGIEHNHIQSTQYSGVSLGWGWKHFDEVETPSNPTSVAGNNRVNHNRVYDVMKTLEDGGALYTLGSQPNSEANGNYVKADTLHFQGVFHPDEGTAWYTGSNMVFEIDPSQDNFELNNWGRKHDNHYENIYTTSTHNELGAPNCTISNLHVHADADWPQEALDIIDAAGLESAYDHLWDDYASIAPIDLITIPIILNPGFEENADKELPTSWIVVGGDLVKDFDLGITPHTGDRQFQIQNDNASLSQDVTISVPGSYLLSMWVANRDQTDPDHYLAPVDEGGLKLELLDSDGATNTPSKSVSADYDAPRGVYVEWTRTFHDLAAGDYTVRVSTGVGVGAGQGMLDDFSMTYVEPDGFLFIVK